MTFVRSSERMAIARQRSVNRSRQRALLRKLQKATTLEKDEDGNELCPYCMRPVQVDPRRCATCKESL